MTRPALPLHFLLPRSPTPTISLLASLADCSGATACFHAIAIPILMLSVACAGKAPAAEPAGVLTVGVSTTGARAATLSFPVEITSTRAGAGAARSERVKADGGIATFRDLPDGAYVVRLTLPAECRATNDASRQITVAPRRTTAVRFSVTCQ
jgi:hypothetical protein